MANAFVPNGVNLIQHPPGQKQMLEKMRRKLASAPPRAAAPAPQASSRRGRRTGKSWMGMLAGVGLLVGLNIYFSLESEALLEKLGIVTIQKAAGPKPGLGRDGQARFWAYAAYDQVGLRQRFKVRATDVFVRVNAVNHLQILLDEGVSAPVKAEIDALKKRAEGRKK